MSDTCSYAKVLVNAPLAYRISYHHVLQLMSTSLRVTSYVCTLISRQLGESYRVIEGLAFYEIEVRLARTLIRLALSSEDLIVSATHATSLICEIAYQALKIEATLLLKEKRRRDREVADPVWQVDRSDLPDCNLRSAISVVQQWNASLEACFY